MIKLRSVQPEWCLELPLQQQAVLLLAARGPDGVAKDHPCKAVQRAYRACVFLAAKYGRVLEYGEKADTFMSLEEFADIQRWIQVRTDFFNSIDSLPHHFTMHLIHGAEILGYKHPDSRFRSRWFEFYLVAVDDLHMNQESEKEMDIRLCDWNQEFWK